MSSLEPKKQMLQACSGNVSNFLIFIIININFVFLFGFRPPSWDRLHQSMMGSSIIAIAVVCLVCCTWFLCVWSNELRRKYHVD